MNCSKAAHLCRSANVRILSESFCQFLFSYLEVSLACMCGCAHVDILISSTQASHVTVTQNFENHVNINLHGFCCTLLVEQIRLRIFSQAASQSGIDLLFRSHWQIHCSQFSSIDSILSSGKMSLTHQCQIQTVSPN